MPYRPSSRLSKSWLILLGLVAFGAFGASTASAAAPTPHKCDSRANNTAKKLLPCIQTADLWQHMMDFQAIADANPGPDGHPSRNSGEPGYLASVRYVAKKMQQAGYKTSVQTYKFPYSSLRRHAHVQHHRAHAPGLHAGHHLELGHQQRNRRRRRRARRWHRAAADPEPQLRERLHGRRLRELPRGQDRAGPARHVQLRREGRQRPERRRRGHPDLQRGSARSHRPGRRRHPRRRGRQHQSARRSRSGSSPSTQASSSIRTTRPARRRTRSSTSTRSSTPTATTTT